MTVDPSFEPRHPTTFLVVFENRPPRGCLRLLASGFRHCFCLRRDRDGWLLCDPRRDQLLLQWAGPLPALLLARTYASLGATVVGLRRFERPPEGGQPWLRPLTCVEVVKQVIGCPRLGVLTPFALFRFLHAHPETVFLVMPAPMPLLTE